MQPGQGSKVKGQAVMMTYASLMPVPVRVLGCTRVSRVHASPVDLPAYIPLSLPPADSQMTPGGSARLHALRDGQASRYTPWPRGGRNLSNLAGSRARWTGASPGCRKNHGRPLSLRYRTPGETLVRRGGERVTRRRWRRRGVGVSLRRGGGSCQGVQVR